MTTIVMPPGVSRETGGRGEAAPRPFHWTADAYHRAWDAGVFGHEARLELIHGRIIENMPPSPLHASLSNMIADTLRAALPALTVRVEAAIRIESDGEPIPDVSAVVGTNRDYLIRHPDPAEVALLVEVAISLEETDLGEKALLYSQAGIDDYWVVLPERQQIVVHREPTPEGYASVMVLGTEAEMTPLVSDRPLAVADLLGSRLGETEVE